MINTTGFRTILLLTKPFMKHLKKELSALEVNNTSKLTLKDISDIKDLLSWVFHYGYYDREVTETLERLTSIARFYLNNYLYNYYTDNNPDFYLGEVISVGTTFEDVKVKFDDGVVLKVYNPNMYAIFVGEILRVKVTNDKVFSRKVAVLDHPGRKYYRAIINKDDRIRYMDSVSYTSKTKFLEDLRGNGYHPGHVVQIDKVFNTYKETLVKGSHGFR